MEQFQDLEGAGEDFEKALSINPAHVSTLQDRAWLNSMKGNRELAIEQLQECQKKFQNETWFFSLASAIYADSGDFDLALSELTKGIKLNPDDSLLYSFRGALELSNDALDEAERDFHHSLKLDPEDETALQGLAQIKTMRG